jgi:hypothetical protein
MWPVLIRAGLSIAGAAGEAEEGEAAGEVGGSMSLDPKKIMEDAANPSVSATSVLARARMKSRSGKLLQNAQEAIARRGGGVP